MLTTAVRFPVAVVIIGAWLGGCTSKVPLDGELFESARDALGADDAGQAEPVWSGASSPEAGSNRVVANHVVSTHAGSADAGPTHFGSADAGSVDPAPADPGSDIDVCADHLASLISADCGACEQTHCAAETESCYGNCRGLISCAADACSDRGPDTSCVYNACMPCISGADPAIAWASCMENHCADSCPFVTRLPNPSRVPPPTPSDECRDDLAGTLGDACTACFEHECTQAYSECGDSCRSLITCLVGYCAKDSACMISHCRSCLGNVAQVESVGTCLATRCAAACPLASTSDAGVSPEE